MRSEPTRLIESSAWVHGAGVARLSVETSSSALSTASARAARLLSRELNTLRTAPLAPPTIELATSGSRRYTIAYPGPTVSVLRSRARTVEPMGAEENKVVVRRFIENVASGRHAAWPMTFSGRVTSTWRTRASTSLV